MNPALPLLVHLLAAQDAILRPIRRWAAAPAVYAARREFPRLGVRWQVRGQTAAGRKRAERALDELVAAGSVGVTRRGKAVYVRLSAQADDHARRLCGLPGIDAGLCTVAAVAQRSTFPPRLLTDFWVAETDLSDGQGWRAGRSAELVIIEDFALPALAAGWLDSRTTTLGHCYYAVTPAGHARLEDADDPAVAEARTVPALADLYCRRLRVELARLESADPGRIDLDPPPLPVAIGGLPYVSEAQRCEK
jgi:hypothetical protein